MVGHNEYYLTLIDISSIRRYQLEDFKLRWRWSLVNRQIEPEAHRNGLCLAETASNGKKPWSERLHRNFLIMLMKTSSLNATQGVSRRAQISEQTPHLNALITLKIETPSFRACCCGRSCRSLHCLFLLQLGWTSTDGALIASR